ncbi:hypothetical protein [Dyella sp. ASV21]|uniref:hypothetical protein n=1 Tax=Dyella sp. ASV21 TaxID=2795114 RepID=UPI0018EBBCF4|nr:hypothetical protein [Dyella sp. ASV21]
MPSFIKRTVVAVAVLACAVSQAAFAGEAQGKILSTAVISNAGFEGIVIFTTGVHTNKPSCSTSANDWAIDTKTPTGKSIYAMLITALTQNRSVTIVGNNKCDAWYDRETASGFFIDAQ